MITARPTLKNINATHGRPRKGLPEEEEDDDDGLELPVNPDEGIPLVPDEEGDVTVPG